MESDTFPSTVDRSAATQTGGAASSCAYLFSLSPSLLNREYAIGPEGVVVGRDASCDVVVSGETVSRRHFEVRPDGTGRYILSDLNSTNGVYVHRRRVDQPVPLDDGDVIGIGSPQAEHLRFQLESGRSKPWVAYLPAKDEWTVGRDLASDISLSFDSTVSSKHAFVLRHKGHIEVQDRHSLNGTWVNGRRVRRATLSPTDTLTIGSTVLRFESEPNGMLRVTRREGRDEIALECIGLTREVGGSKRILDRVSLAIRPGEFVGVLGPSGAGKSTLLKALNGYQPPGYGCVLLNDTPLYRSFAMFRNAIGYVPQDDIVHADLTVEDSLNYVAQLRLPADVGAEQRRELIDSTLETLGLSHVRKSRIYELSGGQRKRVSIGCELITRPSVLFLDEPTSGMDPSTEERLMRHFQGMARRGTTVLITTHILYNLGLLDRVVIMSRGKLVFFGTPGEALAFFGRDGKPLERPTEIFEILEGDAPAAPGAPTDGNKDAIAQFYQKRYLASDLCKRHIGQELSDVGRDMLSISEGKSTKTDGTEYDRLLKKPVPRGHSLGGGNGLFSPRSFLTLMRRQFAVKLVSPKRALFLLAVPLILGLVTLSLPTNGFPDDAAAKERHEAVAKQIHGGPVDIGAPIKALLSPKGPDDPRRAEDVVFSLQNETAANLPTPLSVLLMFVMTAVFMGTLMACLDVSTERPIYVRERLAGQRIVDYLASKLPFLLGATAIQCAVFLALCYAKPGLRQFDPLGAYLALLAMAWASCALGLFLSAVDPTPGQFSVIFAIVAVLPQLVFSGGLGPDFYAGMPAVMKAFSAILPARWGLEMLMTAFYNQPDHTALQWTAGFVKDTVGFDFGHKVYLFNSAILLIQALGWLSLCAWAVKRVDRAR
jgi:ABC-type multidrug transport system ATPase subunit